MVGMKEYSTRDFFYSYIILVNGKWAKTLRSDNKLNLNRIALFWANNNKINVNQVSVSEHKSYYTDYRYI